MSFQKAIEENLIFVCVECKLERGGKEEKLCEHPYANYVVKSGKRWKEEVETLNV